jgi:hypothetical protein
MNTIEIQTFEEIHHVCLLYGLKKAFCRFPFLTDNVMASPPPLRRNPARAGVQLFLRRHPVNVLYYKAELRVVFDESKINLTDIQAFAKAVVDEYLAFRHPYLKGVWNGGMLQEEASGHLLAEFVTASPATDDRP